MKAKSATCLLLLLLVLFVQGTVFAEENATMSLEELLVTATRVPTPSREVASSITVISEQEIEQRQAMTVPELLRTVPGVDVAKRGGPGTQTSVFIRGAKSEHTLVMLNGIEMNDPSLVGRSFDFANLTTENIERIEVLRGPQSPLYGSDAIGGVINIITKKGQGKLSGYFSAEAGSFDTFREKAGLNGGTKMFNYSLGISRLDTNGISSADEDAGNHEEDGYENTTFSTRLGITPTKKFNLDTVFRYTDDESELDDTGGMGGDDPNHIQKTEQMYLKTEAELSLYNDLWQQKLSFSLTDHDREIDDDPDVGQPKEFMRSSYEGKMNKFSWEHNLFIHDTNTLTLGLETEEEEIDSNYYSKSHGFTTKTSIEDESARTSSAYIQDQINLWNSWFTTLGLRVDDHEEFGTETTYRITSSYLVQQTGTKIKGTFGTGFKAPSLYQLYSPQYGNEDLDAEESKGWDIGLEQTLLGDKLSLGMTYFYNDIEDLIEFDNSLYRNVDEAETKGIELYSTFRPINALTLSASYTYTDTEDESTGEELLRRPEHKFSFDFNYSFLNRGNVNVGLDYVGTREDEVWDPVSYSTSRVELDEYYLARLAASYKVLKHVEIFGRVENLFDEDYQEVKGYGTPGISAYGGIKLSL